MRLTLKIEDRKKILADIKHLFRSDKFPLLNTVSKLRSDGSLIKLDLSYSTILGYSKDSLFKTFQVLTENLYNPLINDVFSTNYTQDELNTARMNVLTSSIKLVQQKDYAEGMDEPSFVDLCLLFRAELIVNSSSPS